MTLQNTQPFVSVTGAPAQLGSANTWTADQTYNDNVKLTLGTGGDADIYYDGTNLVIEPQVVGSGDVVINDAATLFINDTDTTGTTIGLIIDQSTNDDRILQLRSSTDVAHGLTGQDTTDTYFSVGKNSATLGGTFIRSNAEDDALAQVLVFHVNGGTANTTKTQAGARGLVEFLMREHDGSNGYVNTTADGNIFALRTMVGGSIVTTFAVDEDGEGHLINTTLVALTDEEDDAELLRSYDHAMVKHGMASGMVGSRWDANIRYSEEALVRYRILGDTIENGGLWCWSRHIQENSSAIWQKHEEIMDIVSVLTPEQQVELMQRNPRIARRLALQEA